MGGGGEEILREEGEEVEGRRGRVGERIKRKGRRRWREREEGKKKIERREGG